MNKAELIRRAAVRAGMSQRLVNRAIKAAVEIIKEEGHLEYKGFGVFRTKVTGVRTWKLGWADDEMGVSLGKKKLVFDESKPRRGSRSK